MDKEYQWYKRKDLVTNEVQLFLLKPRHNESLTHHFFVYNISEFLELNGLEPMNYFTRKSDIVFTIKGVKYAIEVETGTAFSKIKNLKEKVKYLNEHYDKWFFVVTKRKFVKKYKKFGDAVDVRYLHFRMHKIAKHGLARNRVSNVGARREKSSKMRKSQSA